MSEPCRHERDVVAVHGALGAAHLEVEALRAEVEHERQRREDVVDEHQKAGRSWDTSRARLTTERDEARAEIERLQNELHSVLCDRAEAWATIKRGRRT